MITLEEMSMLTTLYAQPHRHYHNIYHINACLVELENIPLSRDFNITDYEVVERAIWYHDAVYNPYSKYNEIKSAALMRDDPNRADPHMITARARHAILCTADHIATQTNLSTADKIMLDIDLAGFGLDILTCINNGKKIRREYYDTSNYQFALGRLDFLKTLALRESLYYTDYFRDKYHKQSQVNLAAEIRIAQAAVDDEAPFHQ